MRSTESTLSGVIFDLDGVIVDSHPLHKHAWRAFLADIGKEVSDSELDFILEGRSRREILIHFLGKLSESDIQKYGNKKDEFFRQASADLKPVKGSVEFIKQLKRANLCMAVATSASRKRAQWTVEQLDIGDCFVAVVTGDDVAECKPDPTIYRLAAERLAIAPRFLLAIEDSVSGVRSAKSAGLRSLGIGFGHAVKGLIDAGAEHVVPDLSGVSIGDLKEMYSVVPKRRCFVSPTLQGTRFPSA